MFEIINQANVDNTEQLANQFTCGDPFRHTLIENFFELPFLTNILEEFPEIETDKMRSEFGKVSRKHAVHEIDSLGPTFRKWHNVLQSAQFIEWLEKLTGIEQLIFDPEYHGAGTHNNLDGQGMDVHVDFNLHRTTGFHRRLNLIIYICEEWDPARGGNIQLHKNPWDRPSNYYKEYPPFYNNAILFETNDYSWHGFDPISLPNEKNYLSRKSLTVYYYSKDRPEHEMSKKHGTIYVPRWMPSEIKPGVVINEDTYLELLQNFRRRNQMLESLYNRESDLLDKNEKLKDKVKWLETTASDSEGKLANPQTSFLKRIFS